MDNIATILKDGVGKLGGGGGGRIAVGQRDKMWGPLIMGSQISRVKRELKRWILSRQPKSEMQMQFQTISHYSPLH